MSLVIAQCLVCIKLGLQEGALKQWEAELAKVREHAKLKE